LIQRGVALLAIVSAETEAAPCEPLAERLTHIKAARTRPD
jgi:hypothetical protein